MAQFGFDDADKYGGNGGHGFFSLKNDKDVARVRFMYDSMADVNGFSVHEVEIDGKKRYVNCLRSYNQPIDDCPLCKAGRATKAKLFIPVYNIDTDHVQIWERGKKFFQKLQSICTRYASNSSLVSHTFEIERNGKAGEQTTTYEVYEVGSDDTTFEDLPELPELLGGFVIDASAEEMEYFLDRGSFPADGAEVSTARRGAERDSEPERRTPSSRRGDRF